jgi:hypothetical protein
MCEKTHLIYYITFFKFVQLVTQDQVAQQSVTMLRLNDGRAGCLRGPFRRAVPCTHRDGKNVFEVHILAALRIGSVDLRTTRWFGVG